MTSKLRETGGAGAQVAFPAWFATTVHWPVWWSVIRDPFGPPGEQTVGVEVEKLTGRCEVAVAETFTGDCESFLFASGGKSIVCGWGAFTV